MGSRWTLFAVIVLLITIAQLARFVWAELVPLEREALVEFYNSLNGPDWLTSDNWLEGDPCLQGWNGVTCDQNNEHVVELRLSSLNLRGPLPQSITNLKFLQMLYLPRNAISSVPSSFENATSLTDLYLNQNMISGTLPALPSEIQNVALAGNLITGGLSSWCVYTKLQLLQLGKNKLGDEIPECIGSLVELHTLDLSNNEHIHTIPNCFSGMSSLLYLDLSYNWLEGSIPDSFGALTKLTSLSLKHNRLSGPIPSSLGNLTALEQLDLSNNELQGSLPLEIGYLTQLTLLNLAHNTLQGELSEDIFSNLHLSTLDLAANGFNNSNIPAPLKTMDLITFSLSSNNFSGILLHNIGFWHSLRYLDFSLNGFSGEIPDHISRHRRLNYLNLAFNKLNGTIPDLTNLTYLEYLNISNNNLIGSVPPSEMPNLLVFDASHNRLDKLIDSFAPYFPNLTELYLDYNELDDDLPWEQMSLSNLRVSSLSHNKYDGIISNTILNLKNLEYLDISNNLITSVDSQLPIWLKHIDMSNNLLIGSLDDIISNQAWKSLQYLDVSYNKFWRFSQLDGFSVPTLQTLSLAHNSFSGPFPHLVSPLSLQSIDLSYNHFDGPFSSIFSTANAIAFIHAEHNNFGGTLELDAPTLEYLNISGNRMEGSIPMKLMTSLSFPTFDFSDNHFCGFLLDSICSEAIISGNQFWHNPCLNTSRQVNITNLEIVTNRVGGALFLNLSFTIENITALNCSMNPADFRAQLWVNGDAGDGECQVVFSPELNKFTCDHGLGYTFSKNGNLNQPRFLLFYGNQPAIANISTDIEFIPPCFNIKEQACTSLFRRNDYSCYCELDITKISAITVSTMVVILSVLVVVIVVLAVLLLWITGAVKKIAAAIDRFQLTFRIARHPKMGSQLNRQYLLHELDYGDNISNEHILKLKERLDPCSWVISPQDLVFHEKIGSGTFGDVFRGSLRGSDVAIKMVRGGVLFGSSSGEQDDFRMQQFIDEIILWADMRDAHILLFIGAAIDEHNVCIVAEYMEAGNLDMVLRRRAADLTWTRKLKIAHQVACGMEYLHSRNPPILHRDLKGQNILLNGELTAKVADFGLSHKLKEGTATAGTLCGSPHFMAPEVLRGEPRNLASDVYSYGIVLWQLLAEQTQIVFENPPNNSSNNNPADAIWDISRISSAVLRGVRPEIPSFDAVLSRELAKLPKQGVAGQSSSSQLDPDRPMQKMLEESISRFAALARQCWNIDPAQRPTFETIKMQLQHMNTDLEKHNRL